MSALYRVDPHPHRHLPVHDERRSAFPQDGRRFPGLETTAESLARAKQTVVVARQEGCAECLCRAAAHLAAAYVARGDYPRAAQLYSEAEQAAQLSGDEGLRELLGTSRELCLSLQRQLASHRHLSELRSQIAARLAEMGVELDAPSDTPGSGQEAASVGEPSAPAASVRLVGNGHLPQPGSTPDTSSTPRPRLYVRCLGSFSVHYGERRISFPNNRKADALLRHLALHRGKPVARDSLIDLCWPDADLVSSTNRLNTTIYLLRTHLSRALDRALDGESPILFEDGHYLLNPHLDVRLDVADFDAWLERGAALEQAQDAAAVEAYEAAVAIYRGDLSIGDVRDDWLLIEHERLACAYLEILGKLGDFYMAQGRYESASRAAEKLLERDPCREDAHCLLMRCLARSGRRVRALRQFEQCQALLLRELDAKPSAETLALRDLIARGASV